MWLEPLPGDVGFASKYPELSKKGLPANSLYSEVVAKFDLFLDNEEIFYDDSSFGEDEVISLSNSLFATTQ